MFKLALTNLGAMAYLDKESGQRMDRIEDRVDARLGSIEVTLAELQALMASQRQPPGQPSVLCRKFLTSRSLLWYG